jgi:hypothetical protein
MRAAPRQPVAERQTLLKARELVCQPSDPRPVALDGARGPGPRPDVVPIARFDGARCHPVALIATTVST